MTTKSKRAGWLSPDGAPDILLYKGIRYSNLIESRNDGHPHKPVVSPALPVPVYTTPRRPPGCTT